MFGDEQGLEDENTYLGPIDSNRADGTLAASPLTRVYNDMGRTDALVAHLRGLDAQLKKNE